MPNVTNTLIANITSTEDSTGAVDINRGTGAPAFDSSLADFATYRNLNDILTPTLPAAIIFQVYVRNLDAVTPLVVSWTPQGGSSAIITNLSPGDQVILWQKPGGVNAGVSSISFQTGGSCNFEYFLGA